LDSGSAVLITLVQTKPLTTTAVYEQLPEDDNLLISPNPSSDYIEINLNRWTPPARWSPSCSEEIKIYNTFGYDVLVEQTSSSVGIGQTGTSDLLRIDISHLPIGMYFIQIGNYLQKFMVVR